jgi:two-component system phosphate regulon sensor histidine kinase PhoR
MNRKLIITIIVVMTIALLGLMGIQVYWIGDAIKVKEATFVRDVNQSMSHVVLTLEKDEMQRQYEQHLKLANARTNLISAWDSVNVSMSRELQVPMTRDQYQDFISRSTMAQEMIQDMIFGFKNVQEEGVPLNPVRIDSIIGTELKKHGINTTFEFGIFSPTRNAMVVQKTGRFPQQLLTQSFAYELYPSATPLRYADQLLIYFPYEKRFLVSQLWDLLAISVFLVIIIILSFSATIFTIIRQKNLSEMKNDFVNNMTHEFKTPISTIGLACEALRDKDIQKSEGLYSTYISMIDEENKRLGTMAEQILQSAVIEKGQLTLKQETIDIHDIITDCVASKSLQANKKNGKIVCELQADEHQLFADPIHMTNVVLNLIDNAIKYSEDDLLIEIKSRNIPNAFEFSVQDNGIGISNSNQKRIFEKLYRVPTGNIHNVKGFGLGLNYVKAIVEQHGGTINLDSELKKRTIFYIRLPLNGNNK